jgi:hypothetical protein
MVRLDLFLLTFSWLFAIALMAAILAAVFGWAWCQGRLRPARRAPNQLATIASIQLTTAATIPAITTNTPSQDGIKISKSTQALMFCPPEQHAKN